MRTAVSTQDERRPGDEVGRETVAFALRAPSVHNTQPWRWRIAGTRLDLYADRSRQLRAADPEGRNLAISCGAALHYAIVGAAAAGWASQVILLPEQADPDHLAALDLSPGERTWRDQADADLLRTRTTDRRRFIGWPVPARLLEDLASRAVLGSAHAIAVTDPADRLSIELLLSRASAIERLDHRVVDEQRRWTSAGDAEGVPTPNAQPTTSGLRSTWPSRFDAVVQDGDPLASAPADGMVVLAALEDAPRAWLDAGRLLCRLWAEAMDRGLSVIPLTQVIEVDSTRAALRRVGVLDMESYPLLLLRLGWQELSRSPLPVTPRRSLEDVLMSSPDSRIPTDR